MDIVRRRLLSDGVILLILTVVCLVYAYKFVNFSTVPFEDAAILMRYAEHLAGGHGIVWNIGDPPIDGATDFLFMVVLAILVKAGVPTVVAARSIGLISHLLAVALVYYINRSYWKTHQAAAFVSSAYLMVGPGLAYVAACFGTTFFALSALVTWALALRLSEKSSSHSMSLAFAISALITSLIRPEGVILVSLMLVTILLLQGWTGARLSILYFVLTMLLLGGSYFLWRWNYFGHPLPNPFYRKGGGVLHLDSLKVSITHFRSLVGPFLIAFPLALYRAETAKRMLAYAVPLLGFVCAFILVSDEMNYQARFQYVVLPLSLVCWYPLVERLLEDSKARANFMLDRRLRLALWTTWILFSLALLHAFSAWSRYGGYSRDGRYDVAVLLRPFADKGYVMAVSEAGLLPFYSRWKALDTWGLNDYWIATNRLISKGYLDKFAPHIIMFKAHFSPLVERDEDRGAGDERRRRLWSRMTFLLQDYAEEKGYILAAAFGDSPYATHYYYVRGDFPDSKTIIGLIRDCEYAWFENGRNCINYATLARGSR